MAHDLLLLRRKGNTPAKSAGCEWRSSLAFTCRHSDYGNSLAPGRLTDRLSFSDQQHRLDPAI
jgi:hypothetical protein